MTNSRLNQLWFEEKHGLKLPSGLSQMIFQEGGKKSALEVQRQFKGYKEIYSIVKKHGKNNPLISHIFKYQQSHSPGRTL